MIKNLFSLADICQLAPEYCLERFYRKIIAVNQIGHQ
jgi:hypothetical protein